MNEKELERIRERDEALLAAAKGVKVLTELDWPAPIEQRFLADWRAGRPELPTGLPGPRSFPAEIEALEAVMRKCDRSHPIENLLYKTADSYATAARMLAAAGTPEFTQHSIRLYGRPDQVYRTQRITGVDAAEFLLETSDRLLGACSIPPTESTIPAEAFAEKLQRDIDAFFVEDEVEVVLDPDLSAKAIAGAKRVRLRASALFSELDHAQLLQHEAYVHAGTMLNGRRQPNVQVLSLGAPRTTRTQEGLAVLAELATMSIDLGRMRRVALRVRAVKQALDGADFLQVFQTFLDAGQDEVESYKSAARVFRGGDPRGRVAFTKDSTYLRGLLEVDTFMRVAIRDNHPGMLRALFAGRMTLGDVVALEPYFESGFLTLPRYVPPWAQDVRQVAAHLAYHAFFPRIDLGQVTLERFFASEEEHLAE